MSKSAANTITLSTKEALLELAQRIDFARRAQGVSIQNLCDRAGIDRSRYHRLMKADPGVAVGAVLEILNMLNLLEQVNDIASLQKSDLLLKNVQQSIPNRVRTSNEGF